MDWITPGGERIGKSLGLRDWAAAQRRARDIESDGLTPTGSAVTIQKATNDFLADTAHHVKDTTLKQYRILLHKLNVFSKERGYVFIRQLGTLELRDFRGTWKTSARTSTKHIERLKRFFSWCIENKWITESPAQPLKSPKLGDTDVVPFTEEEVGRISAACRSYTGPNRDRLIVLTEMMLATGLRIGDAVMMSKDKIMKTKEGWSIQLRTTKTGTSVSCPIPNELADSMIALDNQHPFWSGKSDLEDVTKNWRKIFSKVFKTVGVKGHPHMFRHTAAKQWLIAGVPIAHVASLLGNSTRICEKHYSKWQSERQAAVDKAVRAAWKARKSA